MFYFITSKFIKSNDLKSIFIIGSICYIILHAYLFGNNANGTTEKFRHYMYYLFVLDVVLTGSYSWLFGSKVSDNSDDEIPNQISQLPNYMQEQLMSNQNDGPQQNIADIHRKLLELRAREELKLKQDRTSESHHVNNTNQSHEESKISVKELGTQNNVSPFAKKDLSQNNNQQEKMKKLVFSKEVYENDHAEHAEHAENDDDDMNNSDDVNIPLYGSDKYLSDTDIPLYRY